MEIQSRMMRAVNATIEKTPDQVTLRKGEVFDIFVTVRNMGDQLDDVVFRDSIPPQFTYVENSCQINRGYMEIKESRCEGNVVTIIPADPLQVAGMMEFKFSVKVK